MLKISNLLAVVRSKKEVVVESSELERERKLRKSISKLTHELKNPIAVCNGYLEMLNLDDKEKSQEYVDIIKSEMNRSITVINDFSAFQKIKKLDLEEMDLIFLLEEISIILNPLLQEKDVHLHIQAKEEVYLLGDYNRLKQVFINLIKNSIEAKKEFRTLDIFVVVKEYREKIRIMIQDNGIGISKDNLSHITETFYTTKQFGTGLGTAYCKEIVKLHHGSIQYHSVENVGTKVFITLPKEKKS